MAQITVVAPLSPVVNGVNPAIPNINQQQVYAWASSGLPAMSSLSLNSATVMGSIASLDMTDTGRDQIPMDAQIGMTNLSGNLVIPFPNSATSTHGYGRTVSPTFGAFSITGSVVNVPGNGCPGDLLLLAGGAGNRAGHNDGKWTITYTSVSVTFDIVPGGCPSFNPSGPPTAFQVVAGGSDSNGCAPLTITLLDAGGNPVNALAGGQVFALTDVSGTLSPTSITIAAGSSSGMVTYCNAPTGTYPVTVAPGAGSLSGLPPQVIGVIITAPGVVISDATTPSLCFLKITRPNFRDAIRRKLGLTPPIDNLLGIAAAGEDPPGESYPSNSVVNQAIADAIRYINRETNFHTSVALTVNVPVTASNGVQFIALQGIGAGPYQNLINTVQRAIFYSNTGNVAYRLLPTTFNALDRDFVQYDNYTPSTIPRQFFIEGYQLGILPGASMGGTLQLYAGTGLLGFCSDTDTLDEIPIDYQAVIEDVAVALISMYTPTEDGAKDHVQMFTQLGIVQGIKQIKRWQVMMNSQQQPRFTATSHRRYRWV